MDDILGTPFKAVTTLNGSEGRESLKKGKVLVAVAVVVVVVTTISVMVLSASGLCMTVMSVDVGNVESGVGGGSWGIGRRCKNSLSWVRLSLFKASSSSSWRFVSEEEPEEGSSVCEGVGERGFGGMTGFGGVRGSGG